MGKNKKTGYKMYYIILELMETKKKKRKAKLTKEFLEALYDFYQEYLDDDTTKTILIELDCKSKSKKY